MIIYKENGKKKTSATADKSENTIMRQANIYVTRKYRTALQVDDRKNGELDRIDNSWPVDSIENFSKSGKTSPTTYVAPPFCQFRPSHCETPIEGWKLGHPIDEHTRISQPLPSTFGMCTIAKSHLARYRFIISYINLLACDQCRRHPTLRKIRYGYTDGGDREDGKRKSK